MAYYQSPEEDDKDEQQGMNGQPVPMSGGQSSAISGTAPASPSAPKAPKSNASGMAPGFAQYAKANQGTAQNRLNNATSQTVANQGALAKNSINQATASFGQKVDAGSLKNRENAVSDVANVVNSARNVTAQPAQPTQAPAAPVNANGLASSLGPKTGPTTTKAGDINQPATNTGIVPPAAPAPAVSSIDQAQQDRFKEVINSRYQGPESLRQAGLYQVASGKVQNAQNTLNQTKTAQGREDLLKNMNSQGGAYSTGLNKLDAALLNANKAGVQNIQNTAQAQGNIGQKLDQAQISSSNLAQNRTNEIKDIQEQARNTFTQGKQAEEAATEERLASVIKDWDKLPEYFRDIIRNKEKDNQTVTNSSLDQLKQSQPYVQAQQNVASLQAQLAKLPTHVNGLGPTLNNNIARKKLQDQIAAAQKGLTGMESGITTAANTSANSKAINLSPEEAAMLGIDSGEGLYNLGADAIKTAAYDKDKLISRDEQTRQAVLAQLAGLDQSNRLDTSLKYANADKAGTQTSKDALDTAATRAALNEGEENFRDYAKQANITGTGMKKNKTNGKKYYASESANIGDLLEKSGYDLDSDLSQRGVSDADLLRNTPSVSSGYADPTHLSGMAGGMDSVSQGLDLGGSTPGRDALDAYGAITGVGALTGALGLGTPSDAAQSAIKFGLDEAGPLPGVNNALESIGLGGIAPTNRSVIDALTLGQGSKALSSIFGGGANTSASKSRAKQDARKDLNKKITQSLDNQGFDNRFNVGDNEATKSRANALQQLLANLDKTNG